VYKFNEDLIQTRLKNYIDSTYDQHYAQAKTQTTEIVFENGHGEGFCIGNIIKYAQRFGKKDGKNEKDLYKVLHYTIILLGAMHEEELKELNDYHLELKDGS
jgi:hypothetical protein